MPLPRFRLLIAVSLLFPAIAIKAQAPPTPSKQPAQGDSTLSASVTLKDVELSELLTKLEVKVSYAVSGKVTVKANVSVPIGDAAASKAYRLKGQLTSPELKLEGLRIRNLSAEVLYADGKLSLTSLKGTLPADAEGAAPGEFHGTATAAVEPRGDLTADLTLTRLPLRELLKSLPGGGVPVVGAVNGKAQFRAPVNSLQDPATWVGAADLSAATLSVFERAIRDIKLSLSVEKGKAVLKDSVATVEGIPVAGEATLTLSDKYPLTATVRTQPKDVSELQKLVPELELPVAVRGKLETTSSLSGTLSPFALSASGTISANDLRIGESVADKLSAKWSLTPERISVTDLTAGLFSGKLSGSASVPLKETERGEFAVKFNEIDAAAIAAAFPKVPVKLTGLVSGRVAGTIPVAKAKEERAIAADVALTAPKLTVQGIPAEQLTGKLSTVGTALKYELEGKTLGGSFEVNGVYPQAKKTPDGEQSRVVIRSIDLARLGDALRLRGSKLRGVVDLTFVYASDLSEGSGRYSVRNLGWNSMLAIPEFSGRIRMREGAIELTDAVGPLSSGTVRARLRLGLDEPSRNFFRVNIDRADIQQLLGMAAGNSRFVEGGVSLTVRGRLWPEFHASGTVGLANGRLAGLTATDVRIPFAVTMRGGGGEVVIRDAGGTIGNGRLSGQVEYLWGANGRMKADIKFTNVKVGNVLTDLKQSNYFANARMTGRVELKGESMTSVDDLTGSVVASIQQAAVRDIPVISQIAPFIPPTTIIKPFEAGELRARLSRGVFRVESLTLSNPTADLYADGAVTFAGRLDLGVIVRTGTLGLNDSLLQQSGLQLPVLPGPLPVTFIRDISVFLSNRTIRLNVTGTVDSPQVRLNTSALLTEEAIRFLLRRYLPGAAATAISETSRSNR